MSVKQYAVEGGKCQKSMARGREIPRREVKSYCNHRNVKKWENGSEEIYQKSVKSLVVSRKRTLNYDRIEFPQRNASNALGHHYPFVEDSCPICE